MEDRSVSKPIYTVVDGNGTPVKRGWGTQTVWTTGHVGTAKGYATRLNNENRHRMPCNYRRNHKVQVLNPEWRDLDTEPTPGPQELVRQFHEAFNLPVSVTEPTAQLLDLRSALIDEEYMELDQEMLAAAENAGFSGNIFNRDKITKEMADLLYVVYGAAVALGINLEEAFRRVHASNMSKLVDGKPLMREDGKVLKGPNYVEPDLTGTF